MKNKNTLRQLTVFCLVVCMLTSVFAFVGCGKKAAVFTLDGEVVEEDVYKYWLAKYKNYYISQVSEIGDNKESFEKLTENGKTVGEMIEEEAQNYAKAMLCSLKLFEKYDLTLSGAESAMIDAMIEDNILYLGGSDRSAFNRMLIDTYGFSIDRLRDILVIEQKVDKVTKYLIEGGGIGYGADELERFFMDNYYRVKIVFINTTAKIKTDANGNVQTDVLGKPITEELTEEEKLAKKTLAEDVFAKAQSGSDFDALVADYSEFDNKDSYLNGYYITTYDFNNLLEAGMPKQLLLDSNSAKVGDIMMISEESSGYYIAKKEAPESGAYKSDHKDAAQLGNIVSNLLQTKYDELVDTYWDRIKTNNTLLESISIIDIKRGLNIGKIS
jgi:hypothetical protein